MFVTLSGIAAAEEGEFADGPDVRGEHEPAHPLNAPSPSARS
jgi:hypothetical protein